MFAMFNQFYSALGMLFSALTKFASALNHVGTSVDEMAAQYADVQRVARKAQLIKLNTEHGTSVTE